MIEIQTWTGKLAIAADRINAVELSRHWWMLGQSHVKVITLWRTYHWWLPPAEAEDLYKRITETYSAFLMGLGKPSADKSRS